MKPIDVLLIWSLAASMAVVINAHGGQRSSSPRSFQDYLRQKIRSVCLEVSELKQTVEECCNQELQGCMQDGKTYKHESIFSAADGCNTCVCNNGAVDCTNAPRCHQVSKEDVNYNYKDTLAQGYCASKYSFAYHVSAVRRNCGDPGAGTPPTCDVICGPGSLFAINITDRYPGIFDVFECYEGLRIMMDHPRLEPNPGPGQPDAGLLNLVTISYGSDGCTAMGSDCGPNYCCCTAYCNC